MTAKRPFFPPGTEGKPAARKNGDPEVLTGRARLPPLDWGCCFKAGFLKQPQDNRTNLFTGGSNGGAAGFCGEEAGF
jgi:hypothetical protein